MHVIDCRRNPYHDSPVVFLRRMALDRCGNLLPAASLRASATASGMRSQRVKYANFRALGAMDGLSETEQENAIDIDRLSIALAETDVPTRRDLYEAFKVAQSAGMTRRRQERLVPNDPLAPMYHGQGNTPSNGPAAQAARALVVGDQQSGPRPSVSAQQ